MPPRILLIGGGSGGHIYPLIAVWQEIQKANPAAEAFFVCSERAEDAEYLQKAGLTPHALIAPKLSFSFPFTFFKSYAAAQKFLDEFRPDVIFSKGGAVSVPLCAAARKRHIPIVLHESDAVMGRANRIIAKWADVVCVGMSNTRILEYSNTRTTGNPVRREIMEGSKTDGKRVTGLSGSKPVVLVYGGSQGSQALNEWVMENLDVLLTLAEVIHLTGKGKQGASARDGYFVSEFAHGDMAHLYAMTNFAVSRAGSGTIHELAANGIPAVLIPLRGLAQDHQELNARAAEKSGGCIVVEQTEIKGKLLEALRVTLADSGRLQNMSEQMRTFYRPQAAFDIAKLVLDAAEKHLPSSPKRR